MFEMCVCVGRGWVYACVQDDDFGAVEETAVQYGFFCRFDWWVDVLICLG